MDRIILKYFYSPGFYGEFISKDLLISRTFEIQLKFFWYFDLGYFPDNDEERRQQRRFTTIKDKLPEDLQRILEKVLQSDIKSILPVRIGTDKVEYATSVHPPTEYYKLEIQNQEKHFDIPYRFSDILIEGKDVELFFDFHVKLKSWIDKEFEIASEGKAVKLNKENNGSP
ncbi:hypothetical protein [Chryseobacterium culicis]|uniref:Uncharacterized protein n=1 Tax=Chryseobacterium culicis TaxID=680127 RepID=A0A1H6HJL0_CHRCI|nr:hypothetical protein [Chryseobacterium culicis]SEH35646.1 hypothetical protein SAMN05421593_3101 [Chryseobacterium culicis]